MADTERADLDPEAAVSFAVLRGEGGWSLFKGSELIKVFRRRLPALSKAVRLSREEERLGRTTVVLAHHAVTSELAVEAGAARRQPDGRASHVDRSRAEHDLWSEKD